MEDIGEGEEGADLKNLKRFVVYEGMDLRSQAGHSIDEGIEANNIDVYVGKNIRLTTNPRPRITCHHATASKSQSQSHATPLYARSVTQR